MNTIDTTICKSQALITGTILLCMLLHSGCMSTKVLKEGEYLFEETKIHYEDKQHLEDKSEIDYSLEEIAEPKPNSKVLGQQFRLWVWRVIKKEKGIRKWIKAKIGEPPVLYKQGTIDKSQTVMRKFLQDQGYLQAQIKHDTVHHGRAITAHYYITLQPRYDFGTIHLPPDTSALNRIVRRNSRGSELKSGNPYQMPRLMTERIRLADIARDNGYYDINPEYFYYFIDTTAAYQQADVYVKIKPPSDSTRHKRYHVGEAMVYPNYILNVDQTFDFADTVEYKGLNILQSQEVIRPTVLRQHILADKGDVFNASRQERTINRLLDLGVFKYVNLKYQSRQTDSLLYLDRQYFLTPSLDQDFNLELEASTESNNFLGTAISVGYNHRNLFAGAERLNLILGGGIETQAAQNTRFINTLDINAEVSLAWPRFVIPFIEANTEWSYFVPRTIVAISNNFQRRTDFFSVNSFRFRYGYEWRPNRFVRHELFPINVNTISSFRRSDTFEELLDNNSRLRSSFENVSIIGGTYRITYSDQRVNSRQDFWFVKGGVETSGNMFQLVDLALTGSNFDQVLGQPYSQFLRLDLDVRRNFLFPQNWLVTRFYAGIGLPYGNSTFLPYIKQFFAGGANSIRAFRIRSLGPGRFNSPQLSENPNGFFDQTGDIKLEFNTEYRFPIFMFIKGAVFLDGGNIWLLDDPSNSQPEGVFRWNRFYEEIALGTGFGLRFDAQFVVLRLDAAFPLRRPYEVDGSRWNLRGINPFSKDWRQENMVLHLGIGYPF